LPFWLQTKVAERNTTPHRLPMDGT